MKDNKIMPSSLAKLSVKERVEIIKKRLKEEIDLYLKKSSFTKTKGHSDNSLSKEVGVTHSVITNWYWGKFAKPPHRENIIKLANVLKINPLYLLAESNSRLIDTEQVELEDLIQDYGLLGLKRLLKEFKFSKENDDYITYIDLNYVDIISMVIGDVEFWKTLIHEASRLIKLQTIHYHQGWFEDIINKEDMVDNPTKISYEELVHLVNSKAINKVFDKYISDKKEELNIQEQFYVERMSQRFIIPEE